MTPRSRGSREGLIRVAVAILLIGASPGVEARDKIDVVTLVNGDRITCEIKSLDVGLLTVKTDYMQTISIEWVGVASVESVQFFEVTEEDGHRFYGSLGVPTPDVEAADVDMVVTSLDGRIGLAHDEIVRIAPIEQNWWSRWKGHIDLGASFASANNQVDSTIDIEAAYRSEKFDIVNKLSGSVNDRSDAPRTSRANLSTGYQRFLERRWFWYSQLLFERNEELDLDLRTTVQGGYGRFLRQTVRSRLSASAGLSAVREDYFARDPGEWSAEAALVGRYDLYIFEGRETNLELQLSLLPSLTVSGRYRIEFSSSFRRKLVRDFTVTFSLSESYDSLPPSEQSQKSDTRFRTTLGWTF